MTRSQHASVGSLRAITFRISSAAPDQLPQVAAQIAGSLWSCKDILSAPPDAKSDADASVIVHRFKTQLSTLLQHRSPRARWAGVVLLKATIEASGMVILSTSNAWVRNLLTILKKPDPPTTHNLAIITLTRIFMLTWDHPNLVRELTTPALPGFVASCLANIEKKRRTNSGLLTVLHCFSTLIPRHPTIFRPNEAQIRFLLAEVISANLSEPSSNFYYTEGHREAARRVLVLLHHCSPKQASAEKWDETLRSTIHASHETCDVIFRGVEEDWRSTSDVIPSRTKQQIMHGEPRLESLDAAGLTSWTGIAGGVNRLSELLELIASQFRQPTLNTVPVRLGQLIDLLTRIFSLAGTDAASGVPAFNGEVTRDEREALMLALPDIYAAALRVVLSMLDRFDMAVLPLIPYLVERMAAVHRAAYQHAGMRETLYEAHAIAISLLGRSMSKREILDMTPVLKMAMMEALLISPALSSMTDTGNLPPTQHPESANIHIPLAFPDTSITSASKLLGTALTHLNAAYIPSKLRTQIDRAAILLQEKDLMVASVLNPTQKKATARAPPASLLPMLARIFPQDAQVETLLRPRMPPVRIHASTDKGENGYKPDKEDDDNDDNQDDDPDDQLEMNKESGESSAPRSTSSTPFVVAISSSISDTRIDHDSHAKSPTQLVNAIVEPTPPFRAATAVSAKNKRSAEGHVPADEPSGEAKRTKRSPTPTPPMHVLLDNLVAELAGSGGDNDDGADDAIAAEGRRRNAVMVQSEEDPTAMTATTNTRVEELRSPLDDEATRAESALRDGAASDWDGAESDEGSDIEMPPLTLEPDTESEPE